MTTILMILGWHAENIEGRVFTVNYGTSVLLSNLRTRSILDVGEKAADAWFGLDR